MTLPPPPDAEATGSVVETSPEPERCLNCGEALLGRYCAMCGQEARDPRPTAGELARDVAGELFNWDGKLLSTLRLLVTRPGLLTADVLAGRRARYLPPLRVYLICSVAYFFLAAIIPERSRNASGAKVNITMTPDSGTAVDTSLSHEERTRQLAEEQCRLAADTSRLSASDRLAARLACGAKEGSDAYMPKVERLYPKLMFVLLPLFAAILALTYRARHYPEHLYFALHLHAFAFLALLVGRIGELLPRMARNVVSVTVLAWIIVYGVMALRRVYGESYPKTIAKSVAIAAVYTFLFVMALTITAVMTILSSA